MSQWDDFRKLQKIQKKRLTDIVHHAAAHSPYYRDLFSKQGFETENFSIAEFQQLPLLEKEIVREKIDQLLVEGAVKENLVVAKTGGSTGTSLTIYFDKQWQERRCADAMRSDEWSGWRLGMQTGAVWGNPPEPHGWYEQFKQRWLYCQDLYLDTMSISPVSMDRFVDEWRRRDVDVLFGHAHSLYILADYLAETGNCGVFPKGIIATSMMLLPNEREIMEAVFKCPVTNRYGCEEVALIACECERHDGMHLNIEHLYIEFLRKDGSQALPGEDGEIVVTDLYNRAMPLIRYRVGDVGRASVRTCECGRGLPMMDRISGRTADFLKKRDGSRVAGISLVERTLTAIDGIKQMQIVQDSFDNLVVNLVKRDSYSERDGKRIELELKEVFGNGVDVNLCFLSSIPRESSGKYRFSKCLV